MTFADRKMYVYCGSGVIGVSAEDGRTVVADRGVGRQDGDLSDAGGRGDGRFSAADTRPARMMQLYTAGLEIRSLFELKPKQFESDSIRPFSTTPSLRRAERRGRAACLHG